MFKLHTFFIFILTVIIALLEKIGSITVIHYYWKMSTTYFTTEFHRYGLFFLIMFF